ncbi:hypothetical protein LOD99_10270 [Oopsacas minuta]|uniref:Uncharacterized protein n=1 Tax=Oopsacas minuta TaxID=111878 RepID=A0AAV7KI51_9METZ|nr:hypothetical protein LOD99_10270 [Oopsacas minuta]
MATNNPDIITPVPPDTITPIPIPHSEAYPGNSTILPPINATTADQPPTPLDHDGVDSIYDPEYRVRGALGLYGQGAWTDGEVGPRGFVDLAGLKPPNADYLFDWILASYHWTDEQFEDFFEIGRRGI